MHATVSIQVHVTDKQALWDAAAADAVSRRSHATAADYRAEFGVDQVEDHLRFLFDRPLSKQEGMSLTVVDSYARVDPNPTPAGNAELTLLAVHKELSEHPDAGSRDEALATLGAVRVLLQTCLETIPDNSVGSNFDHVRFVYNEVTTDVDGIPKDEANDLIKSLARALRPAVEKIAEASGGEATSIGNGPLSHLGLPPAVPEGSHLFVARQERDAIVHFESYVVADSESEALAIANADGCTWIQTDVGELDDRTIEVVKPSEYQR